MQTETLCGVTAKAPGGFTIPAIRNDAPLAVSLSLCLLLFWLWIEDRSQSSYLRVEVRVFLGIEVLQGFLETKMGILKKNREVLVFFSALLSRGREPFLSVY